MNKNKHLSFDERSTIKTLLYSSSSFKAISRFLGWDCTTISKEVRGHILFQKTGCFGQAFNDCANRRSCPVSGLCSNPDYHFKNALNANDVIFIALIIPKSTALLYPSLLMSVIAAVNAVAVLWKNISIPPRMPRRNTNLSGPNPAPAFLFRKQRLFNWMISSPPSSAKDSPSITSVSAILPKSCFPKGLFTTMSILVSSLPEIWISHVRSLTDPGGPDMVPLRLIKPAGLDAPIRTSLLSGMAGRTVPSYRLIPLKAAGVGKSFSPYIS